LNYQAVIFDLDGTLYNNRHLPIQLVLSDPLKAFWMLSERIVRRRLSGCEFESEQQFRDTQYRLIGTKHGSTRQQAQEWYETSYMPLMVRLIGQKHPVNEWVKPLLNYYHSHGVKMAVFSDYAWTHEKLEALGIDQTLFDVIADGPMLGGLKPCPRSFQRVLDMLGTTSDQTLMFGDREDTDGEGCRAVGMDFLNVKKSDMSEFIIKLKE
jgi:HAD superfamily hydrolase (TIGR01549 family)